MSAPPAYEKKVDTLEEGIAQHHSNHDADIDEKKGYDRAGAIEAENAEHKMGVLEAVRAYPMASLWAFIMSCTIVSSPVRSGDTANIGADHGILLCFPFG